MSKTISAIKRFFSISNDSNRVLGLDMFRALAILIVVFQHSRVFLADFWPWFPNLYFVDGVDVFFVLSGFLIGSILIRNFNKPDFGPKGILTFWKRRWFRTLPNYYLILFLVFLIAYFSEAPKEYNFKYLFFLQNITTGTPNFFPESWSLAVEEWFYLTLPLALYIAWFVTRWSKKYIFLIIAVLFIAFSTGLRLYALKLHPSITGEIWDQFFRKAVILRFDMLMFGMLAAFAKYYYANFWKKYANLLFILGIILMIVTVQFFFAELYIYLYISGMGLALMLMLPKADSFTKAPQWLAKPIRFVSLTSYSMYLLNYSIVFIIMQSLIKPGNITEAIVLYCSYWVVLLFLSFVLYKGFEKPAMEMRDK